MSSVGVRSMVLDGDALMTKQKRFGDLMVGDVFFTTQGGWLRRWVKIPGCRGMITRNEPGDPVYIRVHPEVKMVRPERGFANAVLVEVTSNPGSEYDARWWGDFN